jgi:DNA-binding response OmpR family regulator
VNQKTILVIDDDVGIRLMLRMMLESAGYRVIIGEEGQSGLEAAWNDKPDLVITDMDMPVHDGFRTIRMFRCDPSVQAPVVVVSGAIDEHKGQAVLDAGAQAFFRKPIDQAALLARISELLAES